MSVRPPSPVVSPPPARSLVLGAGRPAAVVEFESATVDFFVSAAELLGVPKSLAAIYGIVFASPVPLSFADIGARLDLSKGSVSQGLRALREVGAVKEISAKMDPVERFMPNLEMRQLIAQFLKSRIEGQLEAACGRIENLTEQLNSLPSINRRTIAPRIQKLRRWHARTGRVVPVIRSLLSIP